MINFRLSPHPVRSRPVVELWRDGRLLATFYAHEDRDDVAVLTVTSRAPIRSRVADDETCEITFAGIAELSLQK